MFKEVLFTSESVSDGHPDKICDQIADAILDAAIAQDIHSKMAVEASIKDDFIFIFGEANTKADLDYARIAREVIKEIGYDEDFEVLVKVNRQSCQIHAAVVGEEIAAGDQGIMFGYASDETEAYMPLPIYLAHRLSQRISEFKKEVKLLKPDAKTQVTVAYKDGKPDYVHTIVISASHQEGIDQTLIHELMIERVIKEVIDEKWLRPETKFIINPSGAFSIVGPFSDSGTTGRKIVVDTYGGVGRIGGGCFSSKDPSKVDRSAAYYSRYAAKSVVAAGLCHRIEIQVSYAIGLSEPLSIHVDTFGTGQVSDEKILEIIQKNFDFRVGNIIKELDLLRPIYRASCNFGAFGRPGFPWENIKTLTW